MLGGRKCFFKLEQFGTFWCIFLSDFGTQIFFKLLLFMLKIKIFILKIKIFHKR